MEDSKRLSEEERLSFPVLSARGIPVLADYGLEHAGAGPDGETIAIPAQVLVAQDGRVVWMHAARRITDRSSPQETLEAVRRLETPAR
jgi:peroxiredoxin